MLVRDIIIISLLISLVVGTAGLMVDTMKTEYPGLNSTGSDFETTYNKLSQASLTTKQTYNATLLGEEAETSTGELSIKGLWSALLLPFRSLDIITSIIEDAGSAYGIPMFIVTITTMILVATVTFVVLGAIFKRRL